MSKDLLHKVLHELDKYNKTHTTKYGIRRKTVITKTENQDLAE